MESMINYFVPNREDIYKKIINNETIRGYVSFKKSVRFNSKVYVYLIPCIDEYCDIRTLLWYHDNDYERFKHDFLSIQLIYNYSKKNLVSYE